MRSTEWMDRAWTAVTSASAKLSPAEAEVVVAVAGSAVEAAVEGVMEVAITATTEVDMVEVATEVVAARAVVVTGVVVTEVRGTQEVALMGTGGISFFL